MYSIQIHLKSSGTYSEVTPDDLETAGLMVENIVSQALLELFEEVTVEDVLVRFSSQELKHASSSCHLRRIQQQFEH